MEQNYIIQIEKFIADKLIASPLIPIQVQVIRLADDITMSGNFQSQTYITIRYMGSKTDTIAHANTRLRSSLIFEIEIGSQDYLSLTGYELALTLLAGVRRTLSNSAPGGTGFQVFRPLRIVEEKYRGITTNSQYVYYQTWSLELDEQLEPLPVDPCIAQGTCDALVSGVEILREVPDGYVVDENGAIYSSVEDGEPIRDIDGKLYNPNTSEVILEANEVLKYSGSPGSAHVVNKNTGSYIKSIKMFITTKVLFRLKACLNTSNPGKVGIKEESHLAYSTVIKNPQNLTATRVIERTILISDPINNVVTNTVLEETDLVFVNQQVELSVGGERYFLAKTKDKQIGWVREATIRIVEVLNSVFNANCTNQNQIIQEDI